MTSNILFANHFGKVSRKFLIQVFVLFASFLIAANAQMLNKVEPVANIRFSSPNLRQEANILRPFGQKLSIAFSAFGIDFNFEDMELYTSGTSLTDVEVHSNETIEHGKMYEATYRSLYTDNQGKKSYAIVTLNPDDNSLFAVVSQDNETYYFQPGSAISNLLNSENTTQYSNETMAYKASDVKYTDENGESYAKCDSLTLDGDESNPKSITSTNVDLEFVKDPLHLTSILKDALKNAENNENIVEVDTESSVTPSSSSFERELNLVRWTSCLPNSGVTKYTLNVNFVADVGFYNVFGSQPLVEAFVQNMVNTMNAIIDTQMGFNFHVGKLIIHKTLNSVVYNRLGKYEAGSTCSATSNYAITDYLNDMVNWVSNDVDGKKYKGQWHGLTNCFPPAGTVGIAYVGATCHSFARAGISSYMANFYEVVIHELGHNLGSSHAWTYTNLPVGSTGGCMDYNVGCRLNPTDPDGPGEDGFHRSSQVPICSHLTGTLTTSNIGTTNEACWTSKPCTPGIC